MIIFFLLSILYIDADIFETDEGKDYEILLRDLEILRDNPLNLNSASFDELIGIPYLSMTDCMKIIDYREKHGYFDSARDLLKIPGFDHFHLEQRKSLPAEQSAIEATKYAVAVVAVAAKHADDVKPPPQLVQQPHEAAVHDMMLRHDLADPSGEPGGQGRGRVGRQGSDRGLAGDAVRSSLADRLVPHRLS